MKWASTASVAVRLEDAVAEAAETLDAGLDGKSASVVFVFASEEYAAHLPRLPRELEARFPGALVFGCSAPGVIGGGQEIEAEPGLSLTAAHLPDVELTPIVFGTEPRSWASSIAMTSTEPTELIILPDSFTGEAPALIGYLDSTFTEAPKLGGLAGATGAGETMLFVGDQVVRSGSIALGLSGNIEMVTGLAQGCRPIGAPLFVTRHNGPVILELDGKPALRALDGMLAGLTPEDREQAKGALVLGLVMSKDQEVYEQGDFLIRDLAGVDPNNGAIVVAGELRSNHVVQFHIRDAQAATEDMTEEVSRHLYAEPRGALLFSCRGRGQLLYGEPGVDSSIISECLGPLPLGGFFTNGEIGPVGGQTHLHAYTSAFGLFRPKR